MSNIFDGFTKVTKEEFWQFVLTSGDDNIHPCIEGNFPFINNWRTRGGSGELWAVTVPDSRLTGNNWKHGDPEHYFLSPKFHAKYNR